MQAKIPMCDPSLEELFQKQAFKNPREVGDSRINNKNLSCMGYFEVERNE